MDLSEEKPSSFESSKPYGKLKAQLSVTLAVAKAIVEASAKEAKANNWNVTIAVVDVGGHLIYLERNDDCQIGSVQIAQDKAKSALFFKRPTKILADALLGGATNILCLSGAVASEGGLPIICFDQIVGAIGVSGVTGAQDSQIAAAGLASIGRDFDVGNS